MTGTKRPTREYSESPARRRWRSSDGSINRTGGPAVEMDDGSKVWYSSGEPTHGEYTQHSGWTLRYSYSTFKQRMVSMQCEGIGRLQEGRSYLKVTVTVVGTGEGEGGQTGKSQGAERQDQGRAGSQEGAG